MKTMNINHGIPKMGEALGLDGTQLLLVANTIEKIIKRSCAHVDYGKSNSLQDIITCIRIHSNELPEEPITEKELLLVFAAWQLGTIQNEIETLRSMKFIAKELEKIMGQISKKNK